MNYKKNAMTLLELLVSVVLLGIIFTGFFAVLNKNTKITKETELTGLQHTDLAYATRFISDQVSNSSTMDVDTTGKILTLHTDGLADRTIKSNDTGIEFCDSAGNCELIAANADVSFKNSEDTSVKVDFDLVSFSVTAKTQRADLTEDKDAAIEVKAKLNVASMITVRRMSNDRSKVLGEYNTLAAAIADVVDGVDERLYCVGHKENDTGAGDTFDGSFKEGPTDTLGKSFIVEGGYNADFTVRDVVGNRTYIDGQLKTTDLFVVADPIVNSSLTFDGILFQNSVKGISLPAGDNLDSITVKLNNCRFANNTYDIDIEWPNSRLEILDVVFSGQVVKKSN